MRQERAHTTPIPGIGAWNDRAMLSSVRVRVPDGDDGQLWVQSSIAGTHKLPRGTREEFSITRDSLTMISNRGGGIATLVLEGIACAEGALYIGSNRRAGTPLRAGETLKLRLRAGEVLTLRSLYAVEPGGTGVTLRPGQGIVV